MDGGSKTLRLRLGAVADVPAAVALGKRFAVEFERFRGLIYNEEKCTARVSANIANPNFFFLILETSDGEIIGFLAGYLAEYDFADDYFADEWHFYIVPEYRGGIAAIKMLKAYENWCREKNAREMYFTWFGHFSDAHDAPDSIFARLGFEKTGATYWKLLR